MLEAQFRYEIFLHENHDEDDDDGTQFSFKIRWVTLGNSQSNDKRNSIQFNVGTLALPCCDHNTNECSMAMQSQVRMRWGELLWKPFNKYTMCYVQCSMQCTMHCALCSTSGALFLWMN